LDYRLDKHLLLDILGQWNGFAKRKIHLIACGGTAMTLQDIKESTKDVDFIVPVEREYKHLVRMLKDLGYQQTTGAGWRKQGDLFIFDFFPGKRIHTTELLESPLEEDRHVLLKEFSHLYIGVLNDYDLICSKLFRGTSVDFEDCLMLARAHRDIINLEHLDLHFREMAQYDISETRILGNLDRFLDLLQRESSYE
jgi:hypothetical protein